MKIQPKAVLTTTEARQGNSRRLNFRVLVVSLALAAIAGMVFLAIMQGSPSAL